MARTVFLFVCCSCDLSAPGPRRWHGGRLAYRRCLQSKSERKRNRRFGRLVIALPRLAVGALCAPSAVSAWKVHQQFFFLPYRL